MLSALVLLLLATCMGLTSATRPLPALTDDACPPVPTALITSFVAGSVAGGATTLTRAQAAALACQLNAVLSQAGDGNSTATALLDTLYEAWRRLYTPQVWQRQPLDSSYVRRCAVWLANLRTIVDTNQRLTLKYWVSGADVGGRGLGWPRLGTGRAHTAATAPPPSTHKCPPPSLPRPCLQSGLNAYSDFTADEFAANVLMNRSPAPVPPSTTRRMLARGSTSTPSVPASVNWVTAGKVGRQARGLRLERCWQRVSSRVPGQAAAHPPTRLPCLRPAGHAARGCSVPVCLLVGHGHHRRPRVQPTHQQQGRHSEGAERAVADVSESRAGRWGLPGSAPPARSSQLHRPAAAGTAPPTPTTSPPRAALAVTSPLRWPSLPRALSPPMPVSGGRWSRRAGEALPPSRAGSGMPASLLRPLQPGATALTRAAPTSRPRDSCPSARQPCAAARLR